MKFIFALILFFTPLTIRAQSPLTAVPNGPLSCETSRQESLCNVESNWFSKDSSIKAYIKTFYRVENEKLTEIKVYFQIQDFNKILFLATEQFGTPLDTVSPLASQELKVWVFQDVSVYLQNTDYKYKGFGLLKIDVK